MTIARTISPARSIALLGRAVVVELARRRDLYVLFMLMGIYLLGVLSVKIVGIENPSTATFLLNLGLTLAYLCAHALTLLLAARQIPDDLENRTIYPLLARPLSRDVYVIGKWLACAVTGIAVFAALFVLGWAPVPKMEPYSSALLLQLLVLQVVSLAMMASLTICLSLFAPRALAVVLVGGVAIVGDKVSALVLNSLNDGTGRSVAAWLFQYVPDFSKLDLITRYTDGISALSAGEFAGLVAYGLLFTALGLTLAVTRFRRRSL